MRRAPPPAPTPATHLLGWHGGRRGQRAPRTPPRMRARRAGVRPVIRRKGAAMAAGGRGDPLGGNCAAARSPPPLAAALTATRGRTGGRAWTCVPCPRPRQTPVDGWTRAPSAADRARSPPPTATVSHGEHRHRRAGRPLAGTRRVHHHRHRHPHRVRRHRPTLVAEDSYIAPGDSFLTATPRVNPKIVQERHASVAVTLDLYATPDRDSQCGPPRRSPGPSWPAPGRRRVELVAT
jgi:hypothetical protein